MQNTVLKVPLILLCTSINAMESPNCMAKEPKKEVVDYDRDAHKSAARKLLETLPLSQILAEGKTLEKKQRNALANLNADCTKMIQSKADNALIHLEYKGHKFKYVVIPSNVLFEITILAAPGSQAKENTSMLVRAVMSSLAKKLSDFRKIDKNTAPITLRRKIFPDGMNDVYISAGFTKKDKYYEIQIG